MRDAPGQDVSCAAIGRSLEALIGDPSFAVDDTLLSALPPESYDSLLWQVAAVSDHFNPVDTPWTRRAFLSGYSGSSLTLDSPFSFPVVFDSHAVQRRYKPVHRKVRPVPTYLARRCSSLL